MHGIEIFKPGRHTAMNGTVVDITAADLQASAAAYNPALHEAPLVIGHPAENGPAWGWTTGLSYAEERLLANAGQVDVDFAEMVASGKFKKRSASFYPPDSPRNPVPGVYYLRHIGFLGALPPVVKGLKDINFGEEEGLLVFSEVEVSPAEPEKKGAGMKNRAQFCDDCSEQCCIPACPTGAISMSEGKGAVIAADKCTLCRKCTQACCMMESPVWGMEVANYAEQAAAKDGEIGTLTAERDSLRLDLTTLRTAQRKAEFESFCEGLPTKISPVMKPAVIAMMLRLDGEAAIEFGEGDNKTTKAPLEIYQEELKAAPDVVSFSEVATKAKAAGGTKEKKSDGTEFGENVDADRLDLHNQVLEFMDANPDKSYDQALTIVQKQ